MFLTISSQWLIFFPCFKCHFCNRLKFPPDFFVFQFNGGLTFPFHIFSEWQKLATCHLFDIIPSEQSRRDDLESLGYVLMYFNRGSLPWQGLKANTKRQKYELISETKMSVSFEELCKGVPCKFYVPTGRFSEPPQQVRVKLIVKCQLWWLSSPFTEDARKKLDI